MLKRRNIKYSQEEIENLLKEHVVFLPFTYVEMHQKISYYCPICNNIKESQIVHVLNGHSKCKACAGKKKRTQNEAEQELLKKSIIFNQFVYQNNETIIEYKCTGCGKLKQNKFIEIINGHTLCKSCGIKKISQNQNLSQEEIEKRLKHIGVIFKPFVYEKRRTTNIEIKCVECGEFFETAINNMFDRRGSRMCRRCQQSTSTGENELKNFIISCGFDIVENKKVSGIEIDILIPSKQIAFEYNGTYYHNDIAKHKNYHYDKITVCQNNDIRLIYVWDYEWLNNREQIKSYIKAQLGLCEHKVFARDCTIQEIDLKTAKPLLEYHQQKSVTASNYIGLFHKSELVLVMLLNKISKNIFTQTPAAEWEVKREVCKEGYSVIGGKSKVFKYFIRKYNPKSVVAYVDRSKFTGKSYEIMGFELKHINPSRYDWVYKSGLIFKKRQPKIYKEMKQLYDDGKVFRIYDGGRYCYIWKNQKMLE